MDEVFDTADGVYRLVTIDYGLQPGYVCIMGAPDGSAAMVEYELLYGAAVTPCPGELSCRCDFPGLEMSVFQSPEYLEWIAAYDPFEGGLRDVCRGLLAYHATSCGPLP